MTQLRQPSVDEVPISFSQFVITLVQSTMVALGEVESPDTGQADEPRAGSGHHQRPHHAQVKDRGQLGDDEQKLIDGLLLKSYQVPHRIGNVSSPLTITNREFTVPGPAPVLGAHETFQGGY